MEATLPDRQATPPLQPRAPLIEARGVSRFFGHLKAVVDASLIFHAGQVHGLVGPNGAGKSTFLNIIGGIISPSSGTVLVDGQEVALSGPRDAAALGFSFIPQELSLVPDFSAIDNMTLGLHSDSRLGFDNRRARERAAQLAAERMGMSFNLRKPVRDLSPAERGLVAIGHALVKEARFIAMDEPTASLSDIECNRLFQVIRDLAAQGVAVAYVSHRLDEIEALCDRVTVFRDGQIVGRFERDAYTRQDLLKGITGNDLGLVPIPSTAPAVEASTAVVLSAVHLNDGHRVRDITFDCRAGEIVGLGGLVGAGRTEALKLIFGASKLISGEMTLDGRPHRPSSVAGAVKRGIALVPEERRSQGLLMDESVEANIALGNWPAMRRYPPAPLVNDRRARSIAASMLTTLSIKARDTVEIVRRLSGGNQQKVVFARWLSRKSRVLLLDEPTRGVDVGARQQIWATVEDVASQGKAVVVVSSELSELALCRRVFVIAEGRTVAELAGPGITEDQILSVAYHHQLTA